MSAFGERMPALQSVVPGPASLRAIETLAASECPALTLRRARRAEKTGAPQDPIVWARARGSNVEDLDGNVFVDLSGGFGAASVGHAHPRVQAAVHAQTDRLLHALGDLQPSDVKIALLERLARLAPFGDARVMLGQSGADAVEAALKTAALYTKKPGVLAFFGGYHGLHYGALAACGYNEAFRSPFAAQLNPHVVFTDYPRSSTELEQALAAIDAHLSDSAARIGAVLVEPILGRGGVVVPPSGFLSALADSCRARGVLLIVDEIMTGLYRTGPRFVSGAECTPDLLCLGKALGGGLPISACMGRHEIMRAWGDPSGEALHTATFFGHPLASAAALATLDVLEDEALGARASESFAFLAERVHALQARRPSITDVRGAGLLVGIELSSGTLALAAGRKLLARGYITVPAGADARVISLTPPLCITRAQLEGFVVALDAVLGELV